jgi:transketolase
MQETERKTLVTKEIVGNRISEVAGKYEDIVVCDADMMRCFGTQTFSEAYPERHFNFGIAEQNCIAASAGIALSGKNVFAGTFANFISKRACDQVSISVAYNEANVKVCGLYAGLTSEKNGGTHISVEDVAIMRSIPNMVVIEPGDNYELEKIMDFLFDYEGPVYLRLPKMFKKNVFDENVEFSLGKGTEVIAGNDVKIFACGLMLGIAHESVMNLKKEGVNAGLVNISSLKPIDKGVVLRAAAESEIIITCENHNVIGGLGSAVAEVLAESASRARLIRIGIEDQFGITAGLDAQLEKFNLTTHHIEDAVRSAVHI